MKTQITLAADAKTLDALYVEAGYKTEEHTCLVGDRMAEVGADIVEETGVLVALAPFVVEETRQP